MCAGWGAVSAACPGSLPALLCTAGAVRCAGPSVWAAGVQIPPAGTSEHCLCFSGGEWDAEHRAEKAKIAKGVEYDLLQLGMFPV